MPRCYTDAKTETGTHTFTCTNSNESTASCNREIIEKPFTTFSLLVRNEEANGRRQIPHATFHLDIFTRFSTHTHEINDDGRGFHF